MRTGLNRRAWLAAAVLALLAPAGAQAAEETGPPPGLLVVDPPRPAPALVLADMDGKTLDIAGLRGRWVLVHFWASWCGPCRFEMPTLQKMRQQIPEERLAMVLVNTAEDEEAVFAFLAVTAPDLESLLDPDGSATGRWSPRGLPGSFLVDPAGRIRYQALGGRSWDSAAFLAFLRGLTGQGA
ncbi:MAG: TlpA family protein disulfide reductase [Gammaproteobacteria bacterium]|nr:TlpA family protein disulfide reductase [Gammaproteobacteria bacterium]